jgi:hypothetical protein
MLRDTILFGAAKFVVTKYDDDFGVAKFGADGTPLWIRPTGYAPWENLQGFDADADGSSFALYSARPNARLDSLRIGSLRIESDGGVFLVKYSPAGDLLWATWLGDSIYTYDVAADGNGGAIVAGMINGRSVYGADTLRAPEGSRDRQHYASAVIRVAPDGSLLWAREMIRKNDACAMSVTMAPNGDIIEAGLLLQVTLPDTLVLGDSRITSPGLYLTRYNGKGDRLWTRGLTSGPIELYMRDMTFDPAGNIVLAGNVDDNIGDWNFGRIFWDTLGPAGARIPSYGNDDIFLAKVSGDGRFLWGTVLGGRGSDGIGNVHATSDGGILLTGRLSGHVIFGGDDHYAQGSSAAFVARYDGDGTPRWLKIYDPRGSTSQAEAGRSTWTLGSWLDREGRLWMMGGFAGSMTFDALTLGNGVPPGPGRDWISNLFAVRLAPGSHAGPTPVWTKIDGGLPYNMHDYGAPDVAALALFGDRLYAGLSGGDARYWLTNTGSGVYSSTDQGRSWTRTTGGDHPGDSLRYGVVNFAALGDSLYTVTDMFSNSSDFYSKAMVLDRKSPEQWSWLKRSGDPNLSGVFSIDGTLYGAWRGSYGLLRWEPGAREWRTMDTSALSRVSVRKLTGYGNVLLATTWNSQGVYQSSTRGRFWAKVISGIPGIPDDEFRDANDVAAGGDRTFYLAAPAGFAPPRPTGVYRGDDGGTRWTPMSAGLPYMLYNSSDTVPVAIDAFYVKDGAIFAGCERGIWMLPRGATRWISITDDIQQCRVNAMIADGTYLYASLNYCGMWRRPLSTIPMEVEDDEPAANPSAPTFHLAVTPNPVATSARIRFVLPRAGLTTVSLHDATGELVGVIATEVMGRGEHELTLDGAGLASGAYFVRVNSGRESETVGVVHSR